MHVFIDSMLSLRLLQHVAVNREVDFPIVAERLIHEPSQSSPLSVKRFSSALFEQNQDGYRSATSRFRLRKLERIT
jgi:hypothetical protein